MRPLFGMWRQRTVCLQVEELATDLSLPIQTGARSDGTKVWQTDQSSTLSAHTRHQTLNAEWRARMAGVRRDAWQTANASWKLLSHAWGHAHTSRQERQRWCRQRCCASRGGGVRAARWPRVPAPHRPGHCYRRGAAALRDPAPSGGSKPRRPPPQRKEPTRWSLCAHLRALNDYFGRPRLGALQVQVEQLCEQRQGRVAQHGALRVQAETRA